jgi:hypothetical protein
MQRSEDIMLCSRALRPHVWPLSSDCPANADIPPDQISPSNLACLNRILAHARYFAWGK